MIPDEDGPIDESKFAATPAQIAAALEESELSNMICGVAHCRCVGDENGADPDTAFCFNVARLVRQHVLSLITSAAEVGELSEYTQGFRHGFANVRDEVNATIERCAQVAEQHDYSCDAKDIADAIRKERK